MPVTAPAAIPARDSTAAASGPNASPVPEAAIAQSPNPADAGTIPTPPSPDPAAPTSDAAAITPSIPTTRSAIVTASKAPPAPVASQHPADTLDFTSLGARLRATKAIGVFTKISVKNQADDLLAQFREYHNRQGATTLPDLRLSYDMLVLKLLSLVQDGDPLLATDINRSRAAIWNILSDQRKFIDANLMAGASL
jgi:hypothetical protein